MTVDKDQISSLRREYVANGLFRSDMAADPFTQFETWFEAALKAHPDDATSMTLATANAQGYPSARIVLLKRFDRDGFCWFTNYLSEKGQNLAENPNAELLFYWYGLERQVRVRGRVEKLDHSEADTYFAKRPFGSQIGALVSTQSAEIDSRETMEAKAKELTEQYQGKSVPCPEHWGGYRLIPEHVEFWQGRENRLHDRFVYQLENGEWQLKRLQP